MSKMTLEQVRNGLQKLFNAGPGVACSAFPLAHWINAIEEHIQGDETRDTAITDAFPVGGIRLSAPAWPGQMDGKAPPDGWVTIEADLAPIAKPTLGEFVRWEKSYTLDATPRTANRPTHTGEARVSIEIDKSLRDTPNPGSDAAIALGCICPVMDNGRGRGAMGIKGLFWYSAQCPVHSERERPE